MASTLLNIASNPLAGMALNTVAPGAGTAMNAVAGGVNSAKTGAGNGGALMGMLGKNPGYGLSLGMGAAKNLAANIKQKQANSMFPSVEDPELRMLANDYRRRKRAFQTGTAMTAELANQRALAKQGINATFRAGGGSAGLNRMQQILQQAMLGNKQAGMQGEMFYADKYGDVVDKLAQTRLQKALAKYSQAQADAKQLKTDANRMTNVGLMGLINPGNISGAPVDASSVTTQTTPEVETQNNITYGQTTE